MQCSCNRDAGNGTTVEQANKCVLTWHKQGCRRAVAVSWSPLRGKEDRPMPENYLDQLKRALHRGWQHFFDALHPNHQQKLREMLRNAYLEEAQDVTQFTQHAERMHYPQFRERLLRIAAEVQAHVTWLRDKLVALGGEVPTVSLPPRVAKNAWEALLRDLDEEKRSYADLLEAMHIAEQADPELAEGLQRIREEEQQHREEILDMLVKSDPYTLPQEPVEGRP
jgi:rubrerythrin